MFAWTGIQESKMAPRPEIVRPSVRNKTCSYAYIFGERPIKRMYAYVRLPGWPAVRSSTSLPGRQRTWTTWRSVCLQTGKCRMKWLGLIWNVPKPAKYRNLCHGRGRSCPCSPTEYSLQCNRTSVHDGGVRDDWWIQSENNSDSCVMRGLLL